MSVACVGEFVLLSREAEEQIQIRAVNAQQDKSASGKLHFAMLCYGAF